MQIGGWKPARVVNVNVCPALRAAGFVIGVKTQGWTIRGSYRSSSGR